MTGSEQKSPPVFPAAKDARGRFAAFFVEVARGVSRIRSALTVRRIVECGLGNNESCTRHRRGVPGREMENTHPTVQSVPMSSRSAIRCSSSLVLPLTIAAVVSFMFCGAGNASVISIDFDQDNITNTYSGSATTVGGLVPLAGQTGTWNRLDVGTHNESVKGNVNYIPGSDNTPVASSLVNGAGGVTGVSFTFNTGGGFYGDYTASTSTTTDTLGGDVAFLWASQGLASSVGWRFDSLLANSPYSIRIFGQTDVSNSHTNFATFTVAGGSPASATTTNGQNYVDFTVTSSALGVITGTFDEISPANISSMSGLQISGSFGQAAVPEPSTFALAAIGLLPLGFCAWRKRRA